MTAPCVRLDLDVTEGVPDISPPSLRGSTLCVALGAQAGRGTGRRVILAVPSGGHSGTLVPLLRLAPSPAATSWAATAREVATFPPIPRRPPARILGWTRRWSHAIQLGKGVRPSSARPESVAASEWCENQHRSVSSGTGRQRRNPFPRRSASQPHPVRVLDSASNVEVQPACVFKHSRDRLGARLHPLRGGNR